MIFTINFNNYLPENARKSLQDAARRWGVPYYEHTGTHPRDKLKVFDIVPVDRVLFVDADILIRSDAPSPFTHKGDFLAVRSLHPSYNFPAQIVTDELKNVSFDMNTIMSTFGNIDYDVNNFINSGVFLVDRKLKPVLDEAYRISVALPYTISYEQLALNYALARNRVVVTDIGFTWNARALKFPEGRMEHYVYHYAGQPERQKRIEAQNWYANYIVGPNPVTNRDSLFGILKERGYIVGAEIGVQRGLYSLMLLATWPGKLYSIDCWQHQPAGYTTDVANLGDETQEKYFAETVDRLARFGERSKIIRAFSTDVKFDELLDFVYIDANHSYKPFLADLEHWYPQVREGGMIAGHDFAQGVIAGTDFGVIEALEDFLADKKHILYTTNEKVPSECYPSWLFFKE